MEAEHPRYRPWRRRSLLFLGAGAAGGALLTKDEHPGDAAVASQGAFSTLADLSAARPADGDAAWTLGFAEPGDGGGATYVFRADNTDASDGVTTITPPGADRGRWVLVIQGRNNLKWYGAKGDGVTDDTKAIQAALDYRPGGALYAPSGHYLSRDLINKTTKSFFGDGKNHTVIRALPGTKTLYSAQQAAEMSIHGIWFDANGHAETGVDTDWQITDGAPSQGNSYRDLRVSGYTKTGWSAKSNNDSPFEDVLIDRTPGAVALDLDAPGGQVMLSNCKLFGPLAGRWQAASIVGSVLKGIRIVGNDYNVLAIQGGYWYADPDHHANLYLEAGYGVYPGAFTGVHIENSYSDGAVVGGKGAVQSALNFTGCHTFGLDEGKDEVVFVGSTVEKAGPQIRIVLEGGMIEHLAPTLSATRDATVINSNTSFGGYYRDKS